MIDADIVKAYEASRPADTDRSVLCHAPFASLNFDQSGQVTACCYNRQFVLGRYPEQTVREIWLGEPARALRAAFLDGIDAPGCDLCFHQLRNRNFSGALMRQFDRYGNGDGAPAVASGTPAPPKVLEFEISNACSLACVMCGGHWSSTIRAQREKLPPLHSPYDRAFVEQIEEFLPSITAAKFLGGEPFLIERYYDIWERLTRLNPSAEVWITTSGAVLPERAKALLERLRANIVVSLDSLTSAVYEAIRVNASFDQALASLEFFLAYADRRGTRVSLAVCPMASNWRELGALVDFATARGLTVHFNTVTRPVEHSLGGMAAEELGATIEMLECEGLRRGANWTEDSRGQWTGMVAQLRSWQRDKLAFWDRARNLSQRVRTFVEDHLSRPADGADQAGLTAGGIDAVAAAYLFEGERSVAGEYETLTLPRPPLELWPAESPLSAGHLLLAAHALVRRLDRDEGRESAEHGGDALLADHGRLGRFLDRAAEHPARFEALGAAWREQVVSGRVRALLDAVRALVGFGDDDDPLMGQVSGLMQERRTALLRQIEDADPAGATTPRTGAFLDALIVDRLPPYVACAMGVGIERPAPPADARRVATFDDIARELEAVCIFQRLARPRQQTSRLDARVGAIQQVLSVNGGADSLLKAFGEHDANDTFAFLADASNEQFADAAARLA